MSIGNLRDHEVAFKREPFRVVDDTRLDNSVHHRSVEARTLPDVIVNDCCLTGITNCLTLCRDEDDGILDTSLVDPCMKGRSWFERVFCSLPLS